MINTTFFPLTSRPPVVSNVLETSATYTFDTKELKVSFFSYEFDWRPVSLFVRYDLTNHIGVLDGIPFFSKTKTSVFLIDLKELNRHCLDGFFSFEINFVYDEDEEQNERTAIYEANVS